MTDGSPDGQTTGRETRELTGLPDPLITGGSSRSRHWQQGWRRTTPAPGNLLVAIECKRKTWIFLIVRGLVSTIAKRERFSNVVLR